MYFFIPKFLTLLIGNQIQASWHGHGKWEDLSNWPSTDGDRLVEPLVSLQLTSTMFTYKTMSRIYQEWITAITAPSALEMCVWKYRKPMWSYESRFLRHPLSCWVDFACGVNYMKHWILDVLDNLEMSVYSTPTFREDQLSRATSRPPATLRRVPTLTAFKGLSA